jgi:hypothetical protein
VQERSATQRGAARRERRRAEMLDAADALVVGLLSLALVPFFGRVQHLAWAAFAFCAKWAASAVFVAAAVAAASETEAYRALRESVRSLGAT